MGCRFVTITYDTFSWLCVLFFGTSDQTTFLCAPQGWQSWHQKIGKDRYVLATAWEIWHWRHSKMKWAKPFDSYLRGVSLILPIIVSSLPPQIRIGTWLREYSTNMSQINGFLGSLKFFFAALRNQNFWIRTWNGILRNWKDHLNWIILSGGCSIHLLMLVLEVKVLLVERYLLCGTHKLFIENPLPFPVPRSLCLYSIECPSVRSFFSAYR